MYMRHRLADLQVFATVARTRSFKRSAIELGITSSAVSHAIRRLETRFGTVLVNRNSRRVTPTVQGERLAQRLASGFGLIEDALHSLEAPDAGSMTLLRLNVSADAAHMLVMPALAHFQAECPEARLTLVAENRPVDITSEGFDAGIRYGSFVPEEMVAVPLTGPQRWIVAASPAYLDRHGIPQTPAALSGHTCIQLLLGDNSAYRWELGQGEARRHLRVPGNLTINNTTATIMAAKSGLGLAYLLESRISEELERGELVRILAQYASPEEPFCMYYRRRQNTPPSLRRLISIIREQQGLLPLP